MRFVLFYESTESFNYFTDEIAKELESRGHETFILDLLNLTRPDHSMDGFMTFCAQKVDAVLCFNRAGIHNDTFIDLWDTLGAVTLHILMDHPLRLHPTMEKHPKRYIQFCPDREHVAYVQRYFPNVEHIEFLAHAGTLPRNDTPVISYADRKYDILFSGTYYEPDSMMPQLESLFPKDSPMYGIYMQIDEDLIAHTDKPLIRSVLDVLDTSHMPLSDDAVKTIMRNMTPIDWMVRMYYRGKAIQVLVDAGLPVYVLGRGWEDHPSAASGNLHILSDRIGLAATFDYMRDARINLNIMPWFKDGTHDRIFNTMLCRSVCLTDPSTWIEEHFENGRDIVLFDLEHLEKLPEIAQYWLDQPALAEDLIEKAYAKTADCYTWKNCVDSLLDALDRCYGVH